MTIQTRAIKEKTWHCALHEPTLDHQKRPAGQGNAYKRAYFRSCSWVRASGESAVPKRWGEEGAEPEGEAMSTDRNNKMVDRLLAAEMSFPSQGVWAQPEGRHGELRYQGNYCYFKVKWAFWYLGIKMMVYIWCVWKDLFKFILSVFLSNLLYLLKLI